MRTTRGNRQIVASERWSRGIAGAACVGLLVAVWAVVLTGFWVSGVAGAAAPVGPQWAVARSDGTIARAKGATQTFHGIVGSYGIRFAAKVSNCAYEATAGDPATGGVSDPTE